MTDIHRVNRIYEEFLNSMRNPIKAPKGPRKDIVDAIRTVYWCRGVLERLGLNSVYKLEQCLDGSSFKRSNGTTSPSHKWQKYSRGSNTPRSREVDLAETRAPGTAQQLRHILWDVLKTESPDPVDIHQWLARLQPSSQGILFVGAPTALSGPGSRAEVNSRLIRRLHRRANIDALAALVILLKEALMLGRRDLVRILVGATYQMLLILGMEFLARGIAIELFDVFHSRIFFPALADQFQFDVDAERFVKASYILNRATFQTRKTNGQSLAWEERVRYMCDILEGKFGEDLRCILRPNFRPLDPSKKNFEKEMRIFRLLEEFSNWGWHCIDNGILGKMRPSGLGLSDGVVVDQRE
ncbi:hypothetical protein FEE59_19360 [Herbaspirillum sp. RU 5E]|nr:hypothetical protein [Herbaspirillum sp. RU 5E]